MHLADEPAMEAAAAKVAGRARAGDIITLSGSLGAGKTVFARGFLHALGFEGEVSSPTFAIMQDYPADIVAVPVVHADLYRLEHEEELQELGLDDGLEKGILLIEWPERLGAVRWPNMLELSIEVVSESTRRLTAQVPPSWEDRWPFQ